MKDSLIEILVCPVCHEPLELKDARRDEKEIISGFLRCGKCNHDYQIADGIPNLLPPDMNN